MAQLAQATHPPFSTLAKIIVRITTLDYDDEFKLPRGPVKTLLFLLKALLIGLGAIGFVAAFMALAVLIVVFGGGLLVLYFVSELITAIFAYLHPDEFDDY